MFNFEISEIDEEYLNVVLYFLLRSLLINNSLAVSKTKSLKI